jgi:hypothetical protein
MLQEIMEYLNNYFVPISAKEVTYTISGGAVSPSFGAEDGDRFLICGSRRNDGVYTWHANGIKDDDDKKAAGLRDETFAGTIRVCSVPPALLTLSGEISNWVASNSAALTSPMQSETFNGYSYTLKSGGASGGSGPLTWRDIYGKQLERWRRPCL